MGALLELLYGDPAEAESLRGRQLQMHNLCIDVISYTDPAGRLITVRYQHMALSWNPELLNKYFAPGISEFTKFEAPDLTSAHPEASHWLANHFLNSVFSAGYKNKYRQYAVNLIYRAQVAFADYHEARALTEEFLAKGTPNSPATRTYFRAISRWESCLLNLQIFMDVMNKMKKDFGDDPVFKDGDGTPEQRAYGIANMIKHWGTEIFAERHDGGDTVPVWLTNSGLQTRTLALSYLELAGLLSEVASVANQMQDAKSFANAT